MARPRSEDKRDAILAAAIKVIASQGLSAPTALIAKEAGVSSGSLFTYFTTKADLLNNLYLELKTDMATTALKGFPAGHDLRKQLFHVWSNWMGGSVSKRRALAQLHVSDEITPATRAAAHKAMAGIAELLERCARQRPAEQRPDGICRRGYELHGRSNDGFHGPRPDQCEKTLQSRF